MLSPSVPHSDSCDASDFGAPFAFAGGEWRLSPCRALWWAQEQALVVADLHLEKASWYAKHGQFLPPYDSRETLERLSAAQAATGARRIYALGDSFHDSQGPMRLESGAADLLDALARRAEIVWITGNHDEGLAGSPLPGTVAEELTIRGIALRHIAEPGVQGAELSGHFHPKLRLRLQGRFISRPCAVRAGNRMILPAHGTLTGGLDASAPPIRAALAPEGDLEALVTAGGKVLRFPLPA
jgi:DNA ligase-associated metallophosphoesterase